MEKEYPFDYDTPYETLKYTAKRVFQYINTFRNLQQFHNTVLSLKGVMEFAQYCVHKEKNDLEALKKNLDLEYGPVYYDFYTASCRYTSDEDYV